MTSDWQANHRSALPASADNDGSSAGRSNTRGIMFKDWLNSLLAGNIKASLRSPKIVWQPNYRLRAAPDFDFASIQASLRFLSFIYYLAASCALKPVARAFLRCRPRRMLANFPMGAPIR